MTRQRARAARGVLGGTRAAGLGALDAVFRVPRRRTSDVIAYYGFGTQDVLWVRGRAIEDAGLRLVRPDDSRWTNLRNMYRRFRAHPLPGAEVRVRMGDRAVSVTTDEIMNANTIGTFRITIRKNVPISNSSGFIGTPRVPAS